MIRAGSRNLLCLRQSIAYCASGAEVVRHLNRPWAQPWEATGATPMLCLIYVIFIIVALYYAFHQPSPRMAATAAALRQIWSGGCQSCQNSEVSGLSGLDQPPTRPSAGANVMREACVCDVCPCAAIDAVLRIASPLANSFDDAVNMLNTVYCHILQSCLETYMMFNRVLECRTACRHQAQIVDENQYDSNEKFNFGLKKSSIISKKPSIEDEDINRSTTSSRQQGSPEVNSQSLLGLCKQFITGKKHGGKSEGKPFNDASKENTSDAFTGKKKATVANGETEPTIVLERHKVATKEKSVDMRFDEESFSTEDKCVETRPDTCSHQDEPSGSREGTFHQNMKGKKFRVSYGNKSDSELSVASQAYCERCKEGGNLCVPSCPKNLHPKK